MVGYVFGASERLQLFHYGLPQRLGVELFGSLSQGCAVHGVLLCGVGQGSLHHGNGVGLCLGSQCCVLLVVGLGFLSRLAVYGRCLASMLEVDLRRRQTALVVAGSVFQVCVDNILSSSEFYLLHESGASFEETQFHAKHIVVFRHFVASCLQFANEFYAFHFVDVEGCRDRSVASQTCRVDVPSWLNLSAEYNLCNCCPVSFQLTGEFYRAKQLCLCNNCEQQ